MKHLKHTGGTTLSETDRQLSRSRSRTAIKTVRFPIWDASEKAGAFPLGSNFETIMKSQADREAIRKDCWRWVVRLSNRENRFGFRDMCRPPLSLIALGFAFSAMPLLAQNTAGKSSAEALPSVTLPPELDRILREYERAWSRGDGAALASLFADDGFVLQNNAPPIRGRPAIQATYQGQGGAPLRLRALAYASGTTDGYIIGSYRYGSQAADVGKFTLTLRRKAGERWMIFSDMDNLNAPHRNIATPASKTPRSTSQGD